MPSQNMAETKKDELEKNDDSSIERLIAQSLCVNCVGLDGCGIIAQATEPIQFCEMYECCSTQGSERIGAEEKTEGASEKEPENVHLLGLCLNCENRTHCKLPKPQGGVWHCEEYC